MSELLISDFATMQNASFANKFRFFNTNTNRSIDYTLYPTELVKSPVLCEIDQFRSKIGRGWYFVYDIVYY